MFSILFSIYQRKFFNAVIPRASEEDRNLWVQSYTKGNYTCRLSKKFDYQCSITPKTKTRHADSGWSAKTVQDSEREAESQRQRDSEREAESQRQRRHTRSQTYYCFSDSDTPKHCFCAVCVSVSVSLLPTLMLVEAAPMFSTECKNKSRPTSRGICLEWGPTAKGRSTTIMRLPGCWNVQASLDKSDKSFLPPGESIISHTLKPLLKNAHDAQANSFGRNILKWWSAHLPREGQGKDKKRGRKRERVREHTHVCVVCYTCIVWCFAAKQTRFSGGA